MKRETIEAVKNALQSGIEYAQELLDKKDWELGRQHKSNRETAELMEKEISSMRMAQIRLTKPDGCAYGENSPMTPTGAKRQMDISLEK